MDQTTLEHIGAVDHAGRRMFRVAADPLGELVLCHPDGSLDGDLRELNLQERISLAALSSDHPALVVEGARGSYIVLVNRPVDLERHVPLGADDAELLMAGSAHAQFGRRDDDILTLTPWAEEDEVEVFSADAPGFADVPIVSVDDVGLLTWHRGGVDAMLLPVVHGELERVEPEPGTRVGLLTNAFGEVMCVEEGTPLLPHEDIRRQTLVTSTTLLEGSRSLAEASARLRLLADRFERAEHTGWRLVHPVVSGIAFAEHPAEAEAGDSGRGQ